MPKPTTIKLTFSVLRQNTGKGYDQYRIRAEPSETAKLAAVIPELAACLAISKNWTRKIDIRWKGGKSPPMILAAYEGHNGALTFTASKQTPLFTFASRAERENRIFTGDYILSPDGHRDAIELNISLMA